MRVYYIFNSIHVIYRSATDPRAIESRRSIQTILGNEIKYNIIRKNDAV